MASSTGPREDLGEQVALRMLPGALRVEHAGVDQQLHVGVVVRDPAAQAVADQVRARVADVGHPDGVVIAEDSGEGRCQPDQPRVVAGLFGQGGVGLAEQGPQLVVVHVGGVAVGQGVEHHVRHHARGDVTAGVTADPVCHEREAWCGRGGVLVGGAVRAGDRPQCAAQDVSHAAAQCRSNKPSASG